MSKTQERMEHMANKVHAFKNQMDAIEHFDIPVIIVAFSGSAV